MKVRIRGNSVRMRLSQQEVQSFKENGKIKDRIQFGSLAGGTLAYALIAADIQKLECAFKDNTICILVPKELGEMWVDSDMVGMEHLSTNHENEQIRILVEKDFKCLKHRVNEDESDSYPHPKG